MTAAVNHHCDQHPDKFDCPDVLIDFWPKKGHYGIIVHNGGTASVRIAFCPWCGKQLPQIRD
jgi:hypothetical protein